MPDSSTQDHVKPYVYQTLTTKALHFSIGEIQSRMDLRQPDALDIEYTRTMMAFLLFVPAPAAIAMVGLGGGSLAKFCHRHLPRARIKVVEINPHVIALRDEFKVPPESERFNVVQGDGAEFVRSTAQRFDVLLVDGFDYSGLPPALCSQRFYDDCLDLLMPGGVLVVNLHRGHAQFRQQAERIRRSCQGATLVVDDDERTNTIVFGHKGPGPLPPRPAALARPRALNEAAWQTLQGSFARVLAAWKEEAGA